MKALETVLELPKFGTGVGLHRMAALCKDILQGEWMSSLDAIKITGSNGKGSVTSMVACILGALGYTPGVYTSPHLVSFAERIRIGDEPISMHDLERACAFFLKRKAAYERDYPADRIGAFEAFTTIALAHLAEKRPRTLVAEAGIGGRYDPTRLVPGRVVGLTSIDLEHTEVLGKTRELIAYDKADLCPPGGVLVAGALDDDLARRLGTYCSLRGVTLVDARRRTNVTSLRFGETHMTIGFEVDGMSFPGLHVRLQGTHQVENAATAILLVREWLKTNAPEVGPRGFDAAVRHGLMSVAWPGRFERVHENPDVFIDVGHSPDAIGRLVETVRGALPGQRLLLVTGVSHDKHVEPIVSRLLDVATEVIATRAHHKGAPVDRIEAIVRTERPDLPVSACSTIEEAVARAVIRAREANMTVLVAGGLFLSIEAREALRGGDPRALRFF